MLPYEVARAFAASLAPIAKLIRKESTKIVTTNPFIENKIMDIFLLI